ncbi:MAG: hypothetical protein LBJ63_00125 [Prevotellaceae bacterium]|nr:hypothetical protein [Prevotellaceae bacterium]
MNGNAAQTPEEVKDATNATEPTTVYVAAEITVDPEMLASLEAAAENPNVSFEIVGNGGGLKPCDSKNEISKTLLSKTGGILKPGDKDGGITYDCFYVMNLTRSEVPNGAPTLRRNKMDVQNLFESASTMSMSASGGMTTMRGTGASSAIIPDTTYWKRENHLNDCSGLAALEDWTYTIKVLLEECADLPGGVPEFGGVNDQMLRMVGQEYSGHPLSTDKPPVLGKAFIADQESAIDVQRIVATKLEYGTGSNSAGKVIESNRAIQDGGSLKTHAFMQASLPIEFSHDAQYTNTTGLPTYGGGPVYQPGSIGLIWSFVPDSIAKPMSKDVSNSLGAGLTIDARTTVVRKRFRIRSIGCLRCPRIRLFCRSCRTPWFCRCCLRVAYL